MDVRGDAMAILFKKFLVQSQVTAVDPGIPIRREDHSILYLHTLILHHNNKKEKKGAANLEGMQKNEDQFL